MKKISKKSVLLFAAAMAICAFAMPSMASASSWGPVNTEHTLHTTNFGLINDTSSISSMCSTAQFTVDVVSTAVIEITSASFTGCNWGGAIGTCTATSSCTNFPWTATARTTSDIQIHGVNINTFFEGAACGVPSQTLRITGTITNERWLGNAAHSIELAGSHGLVSHFLGASSAITLTGTLTDVQETLTVTN